MKLVPPGWWAKVAVSASAVEVVEFYRLQKCQRAGDGGTIKLEHCILEKVKLNSHLVAVAVQLLILDDLSDTVVFLQIGLHVDDRHSRNRLVG